MADRHSKQLTSLRSLVRIHKATDHMQRTVINEHLNERREIALRMKASLENIEFKADTIIYLKQI